MQHGIAIQQLSAFLAENKNSLSPNAKQLLHHFVEAGKDGFDYLWAHGVLYPKIVVKDKVKEFTTKLFCHEIHLEEDKQFGSISFELGFDDAINAEAKFEALSDEFDIEVTKLNKPGLSTVFVKQRGTWEQFFTAASKAIDIVVVPKD